jgi:hypothetical protein
MMTDEAYVDRVLGDAMRLVTAGVDPELGSATVADALAALAKQAKALKDTTYESVKVKRVRCGCGDWVDVELPNHEALAKTMAQTAKMIDETARLVQFTSGKPDSRPEVAGLPTDVLKALTNEQLRQVMAWVTANAEAVEVSERD